MKIVVTGGLGYIGSHTIAEIQQTTDWEVLSIDNHLNSLPDFAQRIEDVTGKPVINHPIDLRDFEALRSFFKTEKDIDGIIHFAALKAVGESVEKPLLYYDNNLNGLIHILKCCEEFDIPSFIFSSSCSIYGSVTTLPVNEETPFSPTESPYAYTKLVGEQILRDFAKKRSTQTISLRYFNPVGAHPSGKIGEYPIQKPSNLFPVITQRASGWIDEMFVHGLDYPTRDGSCIRDYIHVCDIARAHIQALEKLAKDPNKEFIDFYNLGSGEGVSVLEAISAFERNAGMKLDYKIGPRRSGDTIAIYSDSSKAHQELGWEAQHSIDEMMTSAWAWQQQLNKEK
ncbi:UDP-glucose 4-epimerase GalE [bacterium SCSIO 12741]|nr:UDP-glucose 4-epimerase GalE [bacterium SCSIO 12741]